MQSNILDLNNKEGRKNTIFEKLIIFLKEIFSPSKNDFYAWVNYLRYSFILNRKKIKKFHNCHMGSTVFILGAGPSLEQEKLSLLSNQIVIAYNFSYQALSDIKLKAFYSLVGGARIIPGGKIDRNIFDASFRYPGARRDYIIPKKAIHEKDIILPVPVRFWIYKVLDGKCGFSHDISKEFRNNGLGLGTISAIQIAKYFGAKRIVLLGTDFDCKDNQITHYSKLKFDRTSEWDNNITGYYESIREHIPSTLKFISKILEENKIEFINASSSTSENVIKKDNLQNIIKNINVD